VKKYDRAGEATDDYTIQLMRFAYWINKATNTNSEYVTFIAFPLQQWLHERASVLRTLTVWSSNVNIRTR